MINRQRISDEFFRLASISSPSFHEAEIADYLAQRFRELGAEVEMDETAGAIGGEAGNLIARFAAHQSSAPPLLLSAHMDTVSPADGVQPVLENGVFRSAGETVLGADDKSGIAEILEAICVLKEQNLPHPPLEVVITVCEEVGLLGAKHLDVSQLSARFGLVLDTSGVGTVAYKAPCANKLRFLIEGVESHAGLDPEHGISAIQVAAKAISAMKLGRIDEQTTANIGIIQGGQATNIVPRHVQLLGEARSFDEQALQQQTEHMIDCLRQVADASVVEIHGESTQAQLTTEVMADYPLMDVPTDAPVLRRLCAAAERLGQPLEAGSSGGGSDANLFNQYGIQTVNLASGMQKVHSVNEFVLVDDLVSVADLVVAFVQDMAEV
ncbi:M20/M25/M40 family metallo-hydrolase [Desulfuromonas acetoxidans]|uniref:M20/M25/M40 family metallo-hydrolase n=1 Tax=Desulfuromonas acetoxidans TaxID=891 RepID=UPI00292F8194|nr:M20/M25/M40 family metallo-hydrolase [Desulfuromonas acetoxidans]